MPLYKTKNYSSLAEATDFKRIQARNAIANYFLLFLIRILKQAVFCLHLLHSAQLLWKVFCMNSSKYFQ
jgi:hypothetical protein